MAELGETPISRPELGSLIRTMQDVWAGESYQLVRCNCISFCAALCEALRAGPIPEWVDRFPRIGAGGLDVAERQAASMAVLICRRAKCFVLGGGSGCF